MEISGIYARDPSIILQNMNFSRYYRNRAQLIYSFDLNIIYILNQEAILTWKIVTTDSYYFIDAHTGEILRSETINKGASIGSGTNIEGEEVTFPVVFNNDISAYVLYDNERNIYMCDGSNTETVTRLVSSALNNSEQWSEFSEAISAYQNITEVFDYYSNILGRSGADGYRKPIWIVANYGSNIFNAYFFGEYTDVTLIRLGDADDFARCLDIIGHEYTHAINQDIWNPEYLNESGALDESYADIIGELIENSSLEEIGEDLNSNDPLRSFDNPHKYNQPTSVSDWMYKVSYCYKKGSHDDHKCDNGGVHYNSGIINYAANLIDQNWPEVNHTEELATLFYKSMYYLSSNSTFLDCRHAVLAAAQSMNMSDEKQTVIAEAFSDVGIENEDEEAWASAHHIIGDVRDTETGNIIVDAKIIATATEGLGGGIGYTDSSGKYDVKVNRAIYKVTVQAEGYNLYTIDSVDLSSWFEMNYYMDTIYLTPSKGATENVYAAGTITDALTGEALEGVTIKFRDGADNYDGDYAQTVAGLDIELTTDELGKYYTAALPAGIYTLEASKDGYVTGYLNIVSGNDEDCNNQNLAMMLNAEESGILEFNGNYYKFYDNSMTWEEAKAFCEEQGGYLAVINSAEENEAISQFLTEHGSKNCYWLGIYREDTEQVWKSVTGEAIEYTNWSSGEPNNQEGQEMYVHVYGKQDPTNSDNGIGEWNDASVNGASYAGDFYDLDNFGFICEYGSEDEENVSSDR